VRTVSSIIAVKGILVPLVAALAVSHCIINPSEVVPFVPMRTENVLALAAVLVQVPVIVIRITVPACKRFAANPALCTITVSVVLIAAEADVIAPCSGAR
jgi:hypothetical protein